MLPDEDRATAMGDVHKIHAEDRGSGDIRADRQTQTLRRTDHNTSPSNKAIGPRQPLVSQFAYAPRREIRAATY